MLTPTYLQSVPNALVELYAQLEADILVDMALRINAYDYFIPAAQHQLNMLEEMGYVREEIIRKLSRATGKTQAELIKIMQDAGMTTLESEAAIYKAAGLSATMTMASPALQQIFQAGLQKTNGLFTNLTRTTANTATKQFERALDQAYMKISSGAFSPSEAIKSAVQDLSRQGVQSIRYPGGHTDNMDVAVRRAAITGVNQTALQLQEALADEMGCDLVETTAHSGARPEHAEWQGQIFSRSGKSKKYPDFKKSTGYKTGPGLGGWNCSHSFRAYIDGMPRTYTDEMLKEYDAKNYEYNGVKMNEYEANQRQREIERNIRRWKREKQALAAIGEDTSQASERLKVWNRTQKDFLAQTGLKRQASREYVPKSN